MAGQLVGSSSEWGDSDYEYWITVKTSHVAELVRHLARKLGDFVDIVPEVETLPEAERSPGANSRPQEAGGE